MAPGLVLVPGYDGGTDGLGCCLGANGIPQAAGPRIHPFRQARTVIRMYISDLEDKLVQGQGGEQFGTPVTSMQGSQVPQNRSEPRHHEEVELSHAGARPAHPHSSWDDSPPGAGVGGVFWV